MYYTQSVGVCSTQSSTKKGELRMVHELDLVLYTECRGVFYTVVNQER